MNWKCSYCVVCSFNYLELEKWIQMTSVVVFICLKKNSTVKPFGWAEKRKDQKMKCSPFSGKAEGKSFPCHLPNESVFRGWFTIIRLLIGRCFNCEQPGMLSIVFIINHLTAMNLYPIQYFFFRASLTHETLTRTILNVHVGLKSRHTEKDVLCHLLYCLLSSLKW